MIRFPDINFQYKNFRIAIPLDCFVIDKIKSYYFNLPFKLPIELLNVRVSKEGIELKSTAFHLKFVDHKWNDFMKTISGRPYKFPIYENEGCEVILKEYIEWININNVEIAIQKLKDKTTSVRQLQKDYPILFKYDSLINYLASDKADSIYQNTKGRTRYSLNERQLYMYACHYYVHDGSNYFEACAKAIANHPELIPKSWSKESSAETLRTRVTKKYDNHPEWSQKNYKKRR